MKLATLLFGLPAVFLKNKACHDIKDENEGTDGSKVDECNKIPNCFAVVYPNPAADNGD